MLSRRQLLVHTLRGSALALGAGAGAWGILVAPERWQVTTHAVHLPGLSRTLDGYAILQVSDLHAGAFFGADALASVLRVARTTRPDLVVVTGDLVDHDASYAALAAGFVAALGALARDGVAVVPGNHDYYTGLPTVVRALRRRGVLPLVNDGRVVQGRTPQRSNRGFTLLGVDDSIVGSPDLDAALDRVPAAAHLPRVLLAHNPSYFHTAAGRVGLQLSGHTHGGQINLGAGLPARLILPYGYVAGPYHRAGSTLYVNRGLGTVGLPARLGARPELTRVILTTA